MENKKKTDEFDDEMKKGMSQDYDAVKSFFGGLMDKAKQGPVVPDSTLQGFQQMVKHPEPIKMADGGVPPLDDTMTSLNQTPPTNYDFYKDIDSEQRNALYQQLLQKQHTGAGNVIASGLGGLGDAISNSFGGQHNTYQKDIMGNAAANTQANIGAIDTQRQQRMQDMQGNQEAQMNDPNSPLSMSMRDTFKSAGLNVGSGMPATALIKIGGPLGDFALKQAQQSIQQGQADEAKRHNKMEEGQQANALALQTAKEGREASDKTTELARQEEERKKQNLDAYNKMGPIDKAYLHKDEAAAYRKGAGLDQPAAPHGIPDLGDTFNGGKVLKVTKVK